VAAPPDAGFDAVAPAILGLIKRSLSRVRQFLNVAGSLATRHLQAQADLNAPPAMMLQPATGLRARPASSQVSAKFEGLRGPCLL